MSCGSVFLWPEEPSSHDETKAGFKQIAFWVVLAFSVWYWQAQLSGPTKSQSSEPTKSHDNPSYINAHNKAYQMTVVKNMGTEITGTYSWDFEEGDEQPFLRELQESASREGWTVDIGEFKQGWRDGYSAWLSEHPRRPRYRD